MNPFKAYIYKEMHLTKDHQKTHIQNIKMQHRKPKVHSMNARKKTASKEKGNSVSFDRKRNKYYQREKNKEERRSARRRKMQLCKRSARCFLV